MSAPVKKCEACDDTGSKSRDLGGYLDCFACDIADQRVKFREKMGQIGENVWGSATDELAWRAYQLGMAAAAPVVPVAAQPVVQQEPVAWRFDGFGADEVIYAAKPHNINETGRVWSQSPEGWTPLYAAPSLEAQPAGEVDQLEQVLEAVLLYFDALTARQHGGVAQDKALSKIQDALGLYWQFGVDHRAMAQGEKHES